MLRDVYDAAQVRGLAERFAREDAAGELGRRLEIDADNPSLREEGSILGARPSWHDTSHIGHRPDAPRHLADLKAGRDQLFLKKPTQALMIKDVVSAERVPQGICEVGNRNVFDRLRSVNCTT